MVADVDDRKSSTTEEDDDTYVDQAARHLARMREHDATMADAEAGRQTIPAKRPRALKQTRRAEQNRAAQRAFRERKETHLKELEDRSKNFEALQADYIAGEARRNEVELRARALADRAVQMDARERMLDAREAALRSGTTGEAHQSSTSSSTHHPTTTSTPSNTTGGPSDAEGELSKVKEEMQAMRREMKDREAVVLALRRALEEMSTDNGRLRRAYEATQQELMLRQPLLPLA